MEGSCAKRPYTGRNPQDPLDRAVAERALQQHGVVAGRQLAELGLSASGTRNRVASGRLHRVHRGVFAVGHAGLTQNGRFMAAVLACGPGAVASYFCAGVLLSLGLGVRRLIDVTAPGSRGRRRDGIRVHSAATLTPADVTVIDNIPCTTLARTLLDLAEIAGRRELERALDRAEQQRVLDVRSLEDVLTRGNGRRGAQLLRAVLGEHTAGSTLTRNDLEEAFLAICRAAEHPPDAVNGWIPFPDGGGAQPDFLWRDERLVAEVDGRSVHATRRAFQSDRRRDAAADAAAAGASCASPGSRSHFEPRLRRRDASRAAGRGLSRPPPAAGSLARRRAGPRSRRCTAAPSSSTPPSPSGPASRPAASGPIAKPMPPAAITAATPSDGRAANRCVPQITWIAITAL